MKAIYTVAQEESHHYQSMSRARTPPKYINPHLRGIKGGIPSLRTGFRQSMAYSPSEPEHHGPIQTRAIMQVKQTAPKHTHHVGHQTLHHNDAFGLERDILS